MPTSPPSFLDAAVDIGHALCRDALWWEGRCSWTTDDIVAVDDRDTLVHRSCEGDLYSGTSGIGLFLALLWRRTGDRVLALTARGAFAHAFSWQARHCPHPSLFSGGAGVGLAAMLAGKWLGDLALTEQGIALLDEDLARSVEHPGGADIMHGASGNILAALAAERYLPSPGRLETASRLGDRLISSARRNGQAWSWPESGETIGMNGFSHGAAGVAVALAELAVATGWDSYRQAAEHAVQHEQDWYDDRVENWPDLFPDTIPDDTRSPGFTWAWCHGAPGIGLGRLRLWRLLNDPAHRRQAEQALSGTCKAIVASMSQGNGNYSLCHGLAGNAELLIEGGLRLGDEAALELARHLGRQGVERYALPSGNWPCGVDGGDAVSPNLMLGWAGTGWFYLRLDDPTATPSLLSLDF